MDVSAILQMLQTDLSLQHFPCFTLQFCQPFITHNLFWVLSMHIGMLLDRHWYAVTVEDMRGTAPALPLFI
jgi:hypothetical protein